MSTAFVDTSAAEKMDQKMMVELRERIEELERRCETLEEEKGVLEARIEQRNLQVNMCGSMGTVCHYDVWYMVYGVWCIAHSI